MKKSAQQDLFTSSIFHFVQTKCYMISCLYHALQSNNGALPDFAHKTKDDARLQLLVRQLKEAKEHASNTDKDG